ncbi:hypothetical protein GGR08_000514 [Bartonella fuyuanensis]|uniref:Uncharacterized protein n=1 Tax=Bartonella fuyuanensis TaxID=1460968 RepID=A0A840DT24_9HYPH|nr:hypothetical protein [Bartonella fuyuanensis]
MRQGNCGKPREGLAFMEGGVWWGMLEPNDERAVRK